MKTSPKLPNEKKRAGFFKSIYLILGSFFIIAHASFDAIIRNLTGRISRSWADARIQIMAKRLIKLWRIQYDIINPKHIEPKPGQPTILMCNHSSLFDIPLSFRTFPNHSVRMLSKKEISKIPLMGSGMRASDFLFIDRKNRKQAIKDLESIHDLLKSGIVMWIAPEGTRSATGELGPFKKGGFIAAIQTKAIIIPIGIRGARDIVPARTYEFYLDRHAQVHIGDPIDASKFNLDNKEELMEQVRNTMASMIQSD